MGFAFRSLLLGACVALALPAGAREFRSADMHPTDYPTVEAVQYMGKQLGEQTERRAWASRSSRTAPWATSATRSSS